ncbi:MAG: alpha/beta hydrolase [Gammaproteobacteria bacterium]|nr:alpha/beta hydrolase [Gammaproteobacteria bacterium]
MSRPTLVLVPGLLCDAAVWERQGADFAGRGGIVIADHGDLDSLAAMAARVLDSAPGQLAIAGHSMGGRVAFEVLRQAPERIAGLALLDTACSPLASGAGGEQERHGRLALLALARRAGMRAMAREWVRGMVHPVRLGDAPLIERILAMFERRTPDIFAAQIHALLARPDASGLLDAIRCPTLVLCGAQDAWALPQGHRVMAAAIAGSTLAEIPGCGHMAPMEKSAEVSAALSAWLEQVDRT